MVIVSSVLDYLRGAVAYQRTRRQLNDMDDRLLNDIGIRRSEIDAIARRGFASRKPAAPKQAPLPTAGFGKTTPSHA